MKSLNSRCKTIVVLTFLLSALSSCKRYDPVDLALIKSKKVTFHLQGFQSNVLPFSLGHLASGYGRLSASRLSTGSLALKNIAPRVEEQFLYYWSFNAEDLSPDIAIDEEGSAISIDANNPNFGFATGFAFDPYESGRALSITGVRTTVITLPLQGIATIGRFEFDVSSSNTGAKDFILSYSIDGGSTYEIFTASNQFERMGPQARNAYSFDFSALPGLQNNAGFMVKLEFVAGDREGAGSYNANTGVIRLDNVRLSGIYNPEIEIGSKDSPSYLQYYVFARDDGTLVHAENISFDALDDASVELDLASGHYRIAFLAYHMDLDPLLPLTAHHPSDVYFGHHFNDHRAVTFGHLIDDFEVGEEERQENILLRRFYSNIRFDFEDAPSDLSRVERLVVSRLHDNFFYVPFGFPASFPLTDAQSITFNNPFDGDNDHISFHQFMGLLEGERDLEYELTAFGENNEILTTVVVSRAIPNNVQLLFSGRLLTDATKGNLFGIEVERAWDDTLEENLR